MIFLKSIRFPKDYEHNKESLYLIAKLTVIKFLQNKKLQEIILLFVLFFVSFFYFSYGYQYYNLRIYHYDEGVSIYGAARVLNGDVPYRDFWSFHMPGRFCILAAVFKIFGVNLKVAVLFAIFIMSLSSIGIYLFVSRIYTRVFGLLAFFLTLAWLKFFMVYNRPAQFAILFYIFSWFPLRKYIFYEKNKWLFVAGILTGIIGLFRIDFELYCLSALFIVILLKNLSGPQEENYKTKVNLILKDSFYLVIGFLLTSLPSHIYFIYNGGFREFKNHVLSGILLRNRYLPPYYELKIKTTTLIFYLISLLIFSVTFIKLLFFDLKTKNKDKILWLKLFFLFTGICFYIYSNTRADLSHLLPTMIPLIILFILLYYDFLKIFNKFRHFYKYLVLTVSFSVCFFLLLCSAKQSFLKLKWKMENIDKGKLDIPRAKDFFDPSEYAQFQMQAIKYIQNKTRRNEKIFVGNLRHDKLTNNDVLFYFLSERDSATKYFIFEPGFTNTKRIQQKIIRDLIRENVRYIILWTASEGICEPNESCNSSGVCDLDDFIKKNYAIGKIFGSYLILRHK